MSVPTRCQPSPSSFFVWAEKARIFMPSLYSESFFERLRKLNLTVWPFLVLEALKKYHYVWPFVFISFYNIISYSLSDTLTAANRFPLSNLDSNIIVLSFSFSG